MLTPVGIALGSNLGDRHAELGAGLEFLRAISADGAARASAIIETSPVDCPPDSCSFLNAVAEIAVDPALTSPRQLLAQLQEFEIQRGRRQGHERNSPRPLDLDLLYFGDVELQTPELTLPHSRLLERRFVLEPLAEIRPHLVLPGQARTVRDLAGSGAGPVSCLPWGMDQHHRLGEIEHLAYHLWEREGRPPGRALFNWLKAERLLSDDAFLSNELQVEEEEGGIVPKTQILPPSPFVTDPIR